MTAKRVTFSGTDGEEVSAVVDEKLATRITNKAEYSWGGGPESGCARMEVGEDEELLVNLGQTVRIRVRPTDEEPP